MDREKQLILLNLTKLLYEEGLITETEQAKTRDIINGNVSKK